MEKHANIPAAATWNPEFNIWTLGEQNAEGKNIGIWQSWHIKGHLCETIDYNDATPPFQVKGFHPDGSISVESTWYGGKLWLGTYRYIKSENPTTEGFPNGGPEKHPNVWIAEFDYIEEGVFNAQRYFDKQHQQVSVNGLPLPERPASVPARAHMADDGRWIMGQASVRKGGFVGPYDEWDKDGIQIIKRVYDNETCKPVEEHEYRNGKLYRSEITGPGDQTLKNYYYDDIDPPVVKNSTLYTKRNHDELHTYYDETGKLLYTIFNEDMTGLHKKRYYNGILVFESIQTPDHTKPPVSVRYYYPDGSVLIDYQSNGDGTGNWYLYEGDDPLMMPVTDEEDLNEFKRWHKFLSYGFDTTTTEHEWKLMAAKFRKTYIKEEISRQVDALPVPAFLQDELNKTNWEEIDAAMGGGEYLPKYINGLLVEDDTIANKCLGDIWMQIEHQYSVYEATYLTGIIVATCLPHYKGSPAVQNRLLNFLHEVMALPRIDANKELYAQLQELYQAATSA